MVLQTHVGPLTLGSANAFSALVKGRDNINYRANNEERLYRGSSRPETLTADKRWDLLASARCETLVFSCLTP